jgi:OOP family OmpA-OmpF porin
MNRGSARRRTTARRAEGMLAAGAVIVLVARASRGDTVPSVDVRTWTPSVDPRASLVLEPTSTPGPWLFSASAWLHLESSSVVLRDARTGAVASRPLEDQLGLDLLASLGLGTRTSVGVRVPMFLDEHGTTALTGAEITSGSVPTTGLGDVAIVGKETLIANEHGGFGLAALGEVALPTGAKTSFLSDRGTTVTLRLLGDFSTRLASLQASLGYALRTEHVEWPATDAGGVTFGDQIPWTIGLVLRPALVHVIDPAARQAWEVALHGTLPGGPVGPFGAGDRGSAAESPVLFALSDRVALGRYRDGFVLVGVDVGLDHAVGVPAARGALSFGWTFASHDRDGDGVTDQADQCPGLAEDHDGFQDDDGCPEADNDDDGIVDAEDACPNVRGVAFTDPRQNGCPGPTTMSATPSSTTAPPGSSPPGVREAHAP